MSFLFCLVCCIYSSFISARRPVVLIEVITSGTIFILGFLFVYLHPKTQDMELITAAEFNAALLLIQKYRNQVDEIANGALQAHLDELLRTDMNDFKHDLSTRARNVLHDMEVKVLGDLVVLTVEDFEKQRNCGSRSITEISEFLAERKLSLGMKINRKHN